MIIKKLETQDIIVKGNGATDVQIKIAEKELDVIFSKEYKEYLKTFGIVCFFGHELTGLYHANRLDVVSVTKLERALNTNVSHCFYVVEVINGDVIWQREDGSIFRSLPGQKPKQIANSLCEYIDEWCQNEDFADFDRFAGNPNIAHIVNVAMKYPT